MFSSSSRRVAILASYRTREEMTAAYNLSREESGPLVKLAETALLSRVTAAASCRRPPRK